jgi:hypothetical protein
MQLDETLCIRPFSSDVLLQFAQGRSVQGGVQGRPACGPSCAMEGRKTQGGPAGSRV